MILYHGSNVVVEKPEILKPSHALYYRRMKNISGREAYELFQSTGADEYVRNCYDALHTTGERYILADIDEYIQTHMAQG